MRFFLIALLLPWVAHAELYQCKQNGKTIIQDKPCQPTSQIVRIYDSNQLSSPSVKFTGSQTCKYIQQRIDAIEINQNYTKTQKHNLKMDALKEYDKANCSVTPMPEGWYDKAKIKQENRPIIIEDTPAKRLRGGRVIVDPTRQPIKKW